MNAISLGAGFVSTCLAHPFDFLKLKTFLINEGIGVTGRGLNMGYNSATIFDNFLNRGYGSRVVFTGLQNALISRMLFLFGRNNAYKYFYDRYKPRKRNNDLLYMEKGLMSGVSSLVGSLFSNYWAIKYIREIGDVGRKAAYHRTQEPVRWNQGFAAYALRMGLINTFLIWPYNSIKDKLRVLCGDVFSNRIFATFFAAAVGTLISVPVDNVRTRLQYQSKNHSINRLHYRGFANCVSKIYRNEGFFSFYAGAQITYVQMVVITLSTIYLCDLFVESNGRR